MKREEFLKKIELLDKKQGNYKDTTQVMAKRQERLKRSSQQFIDVFEHLVSKGYKVYAQELLSGNNAKKKTTALVALVATRNKHKYSLYAKDKLHGTGGERDKDIMEVSF